MSTYITLINWGRAPLTVADQSSIDAYIAKQPAGNGNNSEYLGRYARSWVNLQAAKDFCTFAEKLQVDTKFPTTSQVFTIN